MAAMQSSTVPDSDLQAGLGRNVPASESCDSAPSCAEQLPLLPELPKPFSFATLEGESTTADQTRTTYGVQPGDLWQLGPHRLLCANCTDSDAVKRLFLPDEQADLLFFDPPYGVCYTRRNRDSYKSSSSAPAIHGDDLSWNETRCLVATALCLTPLKDGGAFYLCSSAGDRETAFRLALRDAEFPLRQALVWVKQAFVLSRQDYHWRHETVLYGWKGGSSHAFYGGRTEQTVWEIDRPLRSHEHPTVKPVALVVRALRNSTQQGAVVYDGFAGSGTTLLACETTRRIARVMEIEPRHCEKILRRWQAWTGQQPIVVL